MSRHPLHSAGQSTLSEYRARRRQWVELDRPRAIKRALCLLAAAAVIDGIVVAVLMGWRWPPAVVKVLGVVLAFWTLLAVVNRLRVPSLITELALRAQAERRAGDALTGLERAGFHVLSDRNTTAGHLAAFVIGPTGLFALTVVPAPRGLTFTHHGYVAGPVSLHAAATTAWATAQAAADTLAEAQPDWALTVHPLIVIDTPHSLPLGAGEVNGVPMVPMKQLSATLRHSYPRFLPDAHALALAESAFHQLPAAEPLTGTDEWSISDDLPIGVDEPNQ